MEHVWEVCVAGRRGPRRGRGCGVVVRWCVTPGRGGRDREVVRWYAEGPRAALLRWCGGAVVRAAVVHGAVGMSHGCAVPRAGTRCSRAPDSAAPPVASAATMKRGNCGPGSAGAHEGRVLWGVTDRSFGRGDRRCTDSRQRAGEPDTGKTLVRPLPLPLGVPASQVRGVGQPSGGGAGAAWAGGVGPGQEVGRRERTAGRGPGARGSRAIPEGADRPGGRPHGGRAAGWAGGGWRAG